MKIIWLCNMSIPSVCRLTGDSVSVFGGWLSDMSERLLSAEENSFVLLYPDKRCRRGQQDHLFYYEFREDDCFDLFQEVIEAHNPDVIHIWGTDQRTLEMMCACEALHVTDRAVISITGLTSICARHYCTGLPEKVVKHKTFHERLRGTNIQYYQKQFVEYGKAEIRTLQLAKSVIGRTDFDKACTLQINPNLRYYYCGETLRACFYHRKWDRSKAKPHSIFVSQCSYPVKGFHYVLEAVQILKKTFPDVHVYTTGPDVRKLARNKLKVFTYAQYLSELIFRYDIDQNVTFLGTLDGEQMCQQYLEANVFVSASTIENSSNSVGEAMLVGCPVVASDVGGTQSLLRHGEEGFLYPVDAPYLLAFYVSRIFEEGELAEKISHNARIRAEQNHDAEKNFARLTSIYEEISRKEDTDGTK